MLDTFAIDQEINDNIEVSIGPKLTPSSSIVPKDVPATGQNPTQEPEAPHECSQNIVYWRIHLLIYSVIVITTMYY